MPNKNLHIALFGPPGAGKSTQAKFLLKRWPVVSVSSGKMLRTEAATGTELGLKVRPLLDRGELVADEIVIAVIRKWLQSLPFNQGFLLDGFPRTIPQAIALDKILLESNRPLNGVIDLTLTVSEAVYRLSGRRTCQGAGPDEIIHINDEAAVERCLGRGGILVQRSDDLPNVIVRRMSVYEEETEPLINFYRPRGIVHVVDASGSPEAVSQNICEEFKYWQLLDHNNRPKQVEPPQSRL